MIVLMTLACTTSRTVETPASACDAYPADAVRPMEEGSVLYPYKWPEAQDLSTGTVADLDLGAVPCDTDPDIDWSPFDKLLFVSIPAW